MYNHGHQKSLLVVTILWITHTAGENTYEHLQFQSSMGMHYEYHGAVRIQVTNWRINTFLRVDKL